MVPDGGLQGVSLASVRQRVDGERVGTQNFCLSTRGGQFLECFCPAAGAAEIRAEHEMRIGPESRCLN